MQCLQHLASRKLYSNYIALYHIFAHINNLLKISFQFSILSYNNIKLEKFSLLLKNILCFTINIITHKCF